MPLSSRHSQQARVLRLVDGVLKGEPDAAKGLMFEFPRTSLDGLCRLVARHGTVSCVVFDLLADAHQACHAMDGFEAAYAEG